MTGKPIFVACSRGGTYSPGTGGEAFDHQTTCLKTILGFIGFSELRILAVEPTLAAGPDAAAKARKDAIAKAKETAKSF